MLNPEVAEAVRIVSLYPASSEATGSLTNCWKGGSLAELAADVVRAAATMGRAMPALTRSTMGGMQLAKLVAEGHGLALLLWLQSCSARADVRAAPLLSQTMKDPSLRERTEQVARERVLFGPMQDALAVLPYTGSGAWLVDDNHKHIRARLELLVWEAGAQAMQLPELSTWLWGDEIARTTLVTGAARTTLRGRALAARWFEMTAKGFPTEWWQDLQEPLMTAVQGLFVHPDPIVWVHAARGLGRLTGPFPSLEGMLLDWTTSPSNLLRRRATTALTAQPAERLRMVSRQLTELFSDDRADPWQLAAATLSAPYLTFEHRELWNELLTGIVARAPSAAVSRSVAQGLMALWRRNVRGPSVEDPLRELRTRAQGIEAGDVSDWQLWHDVLAETDALDEVERDPLDVERAIHNLVRRATHALDSDLGRRMAHTVESIVPTFQTALELSRRETDAHKRASALNALEGAARSLSLCLWTPVLAATGYPVASPWPAHSAMSEAVRDLLGQKQVDVPLHRTALRIASSLLDADREFGAVADGRVQHATTARTVCSLLNEVPWLAPSQDDEESGTSGAAKFERPMGEIVYRLIDAGWGGALPNGADKEWLGPYAAWWALVVDQTRLLQTLEKALPLFEPSMVELCCDEADDLRKRLLAENASRGDWHEGALANLRELQAENTELARALLDLDGALSMFADSKGTQEDFAFWAEQLVAEAERLRLAMDDPAVALGPARQKLLPSDEVQQITSQLVTAVRTSNTTSLAFWFRKLGPVIGPIIERACSGAVERTPRPPPPPTRKKTMFGGYELLRPLGEGGMGSVWLVQRPGAMRHLVMKRPHEDALRKANAMEREGILQSFSEEARVLASLHHPNVAPIFDHGVADGMPFLVLEYLVGCDLKAYVKARPMSIAELKPVVRGACEGLGALHDRDLVHRDVKPANIWLWINLGDELFDAAKHRDPARKPILSTVVIDFGLVRAFNVEHGGRVVAGTAGYIAPEQVRDPIGLDGRADTYSIAATVYNAMTGRAFFDDISDDMKRYLAHMNQEPLATDERVASFPPALVQLLRRATAKDPEARPDVREFARAFGDL